MDLGSIRSAGWPVAPRGWWGDGLGGLRRGVVVPVGGDVAEPVVGELVVSVDGFDGAFGDTGPAVDASDRVDVELLDGGVVRFVGGGVDDVDRTGLHAAVVFAAGAGLGDSDRLFWPHRDGLIWPHWRRAGAVVTV